MTTAGLSSSVEVSLASLLDLGVEWWRLNSWLNQGDTNRSNLVVRHVVRKMREFLAELEIDVMHMTGQTYVAGLAVEVVDTVADDRQGSGDGWVITETLSPIVLWRKQVVRHGQVVTQRTSHPMGAVETGDVAHE